MRLALNKNINQPEWKITDRLQQWSIIQNVSADGYDWFIGTDKWSEERNDQIYSNIYIYTAKFYTTMDTICLLFLMGGDNG